jgi:hypothetical protein
MTTESPVVILYNEDGYRLDVKNNISIPSGTTSILISGSNSGTAKLLRLDSSGNTIVTGNGTAGSPDSGVVTIQGIGGGTPVPISGSITASNASIGSNGSAIPSSSTLIGGSDGTNLQPFRVFDLDSGAGSQYVQGVNLRLTANGGSVEFGTSSNPIRIDPTGTTTQPISAASLPLPAGAATETTLTGVLTTTAFQARINTLGQKTMANSTPVVLASDQSSIPVTQSGTWTVQPGNTANTTPWLTTISQGGNSAIVTASNALKVDGSAVTQPISGTVTANQGGAPWSENITQFGGNSVVTGTGASGLGIPRVTVSNDSNILATQSGTWTVQPGNTANTTPWLTTISQGGNSATVTASNALKVDGSAVTQPVSGTVTVTQSTASNLNATVIGTGTDNTTNSTSKLPVLAARANTSAPTWTDGYMVPLSVDTTGALRIGGTITANNASVTTTGSAPPASATYVAGSVTTNPPTYTTGQLSGLSLNTSGQLRVESKYRELATFTALSTATAPANNKSMFSIVNASGSAVTLKIQEIYLINVQQTAVGGVTLTFELRRITNHSGGTAITAIETMDSGDALNGSITARTNSTVSGESATLLWRSLWSSDEWSPGNSDVESNDHEFQTMFPIYSKKTNDSKPITLRANEGLTIKCTTNSTVGSFDIFVVFTQE